MEEGELIETAPASEISGKVLVPEGVGFEETKERLFVRRFIKGFIVALFVAVLVWFFVVMFYYARLTIVIDKNSDSPEAGVVVSKAVLLMIDEKEKGFGKYLFYAAKMGAESSLEAYESQTTPGEVAHYEQTHSFKLGLAF